MAHGKDHKSELSSKNLTKSVMEKAENNKGRDRLSELPDCIIQDILLNLSSLEEIESIKSLSKRWRHIVPYSLRSLVLDEVFWPSSTYKGSNLRANPTRFETYVDGAMKRLLKNEVNINKFELRLCQDHENSVIDDWIKMAIDSFAEEICFGIYDPHIDVFWTRSYYRDKRFPASVFTAKSLKSLTIRSNDVAFFWDELFSVEISLPCLKRLEFCRVHCNDATIHHIIASCPKLEELLLLEVSGVRKLQLTNHNNILKYVTVHQAHNGSIMVEAPMIERFVFRANLCLQQFKLIAMENLRFLEIDCCCQPILGTVLCEAISRLPMLEVLHFPNCFEYEKLEIRSSSIKEIRLECCDDSVDVEIDAPNLCRFYRSSNEPLKFFGARRNTTYWEVELHDKLNCSWLAKLRESLHKQSPFQIFFMSCISCSKEKATELKEIENSNVPHTAPKIDHLKLDLRASCKPCFVAIAMSIIWNCRPKLLTFGTATVKKYIELLFKELQKAAATGCCRGNGSKCWRHYLENVNKISFTEIEALNPPYFYASHYYDEGSPYGCVCVKLDWRV